MLVQGGSCSGERSHRGEWVSGYRYKSGSRRNGETGEGGIPFFSFFGLASEEWRRLYKNIVTTPGRSVCARAE